MARSEKRPGTPLGRGYRSGLSNQAAQWALPRLVKILGPRLRPLRSPGRIARHEKRPAAPLGRGYRTGLSNQAARWALPRLIKILGPGSGRFGHLAE